MSSRTGRALDDEREQIVHARADLGAVRVDEQPDERDVRPRALVGELARKTLADLAPTVAKEAVVSLDVTARIAGTKYRVRGAPPGGGAPGAEGGDEDMGKRCTHFDGTVAAPRSTRCEGCGSTFNLRVCTTCGHVGCCESQKGHNTAHAKAAGHPIIKSLPLEPGGFTWCYTCNAYVD